jgi:hypothetical protein
LRESKLTRGGDLVSLIGYDTFMGRKKIKRKRRKSLISKGGEGEFARG